MKNNKIKKTIGINKFAHLKKVHKALIFVAQRLNSLNIKWLLGASGSLMVHGVDIVPWDLDIFTSAEKVKLLEKEFKQYVINPLHYFDQKNQREIEFQMKINGIEVEVCELVNLGFPKPVLFQNTPVFVNPLKDELKFYEQRLGKEEVVRLIKEKLNI